MAEPTDAAFEKKLLEAVARAIDNATVRTGVHGPRAAKARVRAEAAIAAYRRCEVERNG